MRIESLLLVAVLAMAPSSLAAAEVEPASDVAQANDEVAAVDPVPAEEGVAEALASGQPVEETAAAMADEIAWDDLDALEDPEFARVPAPAEPERAAAAAPVEIEGSTLVVAGITLGPVGVDAEGRVGRIHTVKSGDTLWDVSQAYLGTAWVWPSVWDDNSEIQNPHLILPGDRLWISSTQIRPISDAEADAYLAAAEPADEEVPSELPADLDESAAQDEFADETMGELPVAVTDDAARGNETGRVMRVSMREDMGFVSDAQLRASTTIVGSPSERRHLSMLDTIYLGFGVGEVQVGEEFTLFRNVTEVRSPRSRDLLGYHVEILGWAEVIEVADESSVAVIRVSLDGTLEGDRVMPRKRIPTDIKVKYPPEQVEGQIAFMPSRRTLMGTADYVFVDVGAVQGIEVGSDLEVYDAGSPARDETRNRLVRTPDRVIADLVVVTVQEETAVAYVAHTRRELAVGDSVRGSSRDFPSAF